MGAPIALVIAGQADIEYENTEALLNDWLGFGEPDSEGLYGKPENAVEIFFPVTEAHWSDGLDTVVDWSAAAGLNFNAVIEAERGDSVEKILEDADKVKETSDVNKTLIEVLLFAREKGADVYLLLLWGELGDPESEELLSLAAEHDIPVKDLAEGLDDIRFSEGDAESEPEPEPEPEEKPSRSQRRRKEAVAEELPDDDEPLTEPEPGEMAATVEKPKRSRAKKSEAGPPTEGQTTLEEQIAQAAHEKRVPTTIEVESLDDGDPLKMALVLTEDRARELVREEIAAFLLATVMDLGLIAPAVEATGAPETPQEPEVTEEPVPAAPKRAGRGGRPRKDGSPAQPQTKAYLVDEDGEYSKRGRGKPRTGSKVVDLTKAEALEKGLEWD